LPFWRDAEPLLIATGLMQATDPPATQRAAGVILTMQAP
jgi:hypothetical protein